jgi:predicted adenylyl cyclase CyaB
MPKEIETKFKLLSGPRLRTVLRKKGYKFVSKEFESDVYYESPGRNVRDMVVRLRRGRGKGGLFTVKLPGTGKDKRFKVRDEFETCVQDAGRFDEILKALGSKKIQKRKVQGNLPLRPVPGPP